MDFSIAAVFRSNMVIQRDIPVPVWGTAPAEAAVEVALDGISVQTAAAPDGSWTAVLPAGPASGPLTLCVRCGTEEICLRDVYRGEVWLAGGQSNMELALRDSQEGEQAVAESSIERLHLYAVPKAVTAEEAVRLEQEASWQISSPETAGTFSAVAWYAGKTLAELLPEVHIGVIQCCWGGTFAHCWLPETDLQSFPEGQYRVEEYNARMGNKSAEMFAQELSDYQREVDAWNARILARRAAEPDVTWETLNEECGLYPWPPPAGPTGFQRPGLLYQTMLRRIQPFALRGFWYYQGEQDEDRPNAYAAMLTALLHRWRQDWGGEEKPFLLVQLPMYLAKADAITGDPMRWPVLRQAQANAAGPHTGLVVLADCGEFDNVHPIDKRTPGSRLGLLAAEMVYHLSVTGRPPVCTEARWENGGVTLRFRCTGGGLTLRGGGFQLVGPDGSVHTADAEVTGPDTVRVTAIPDAVEVRYAWYSYGPAGLYGGTGLAAQPFMLKI